MKRYRQNAPKPTFHGIVRYRSTDEPLLNEKYEHLFYSGEELTVSKSYKHLFLWCKKINQFVLFGPSEYLLQ
ncbi:MAG: hypothetical protein DRH93_13965 [Deltaproteobacteria bacterium]|nr:MAG: hypothetical protein DRH93_13965 [Deltaproteobacteria bacterium]